MKIVEHLGVPYIVQNIVQAKLDEKGCWSGK